MLTIRVIVLPRPDSPKNAKKPTTAKKAAVKQAATKKAPVEPSDSEVAGE